jgi:threonine/homoserine/homoserine lactone efflux protein
MLDPNLLPLFLAAVFILAITPGPDTLLVIAHSLAGGARRGLLATAGILVGCIAHSLLAAAGIATLVVAAPFILTLIQWVGALYLAYIGVISLRSAWQRHRQSQAVARPAEPQAVVAVQSSRAILQQALLTNLLNPKVLIFFLAFLPQFVQPTLGQVGLQMFTLGMIFSLIGCGYLVAVAALTGVATHALRRRPWVATTLEATSGLIFFGLAVRLLLDRRGTL